MVAVLLDHAPPAGPPGGRCPGHRSSPSTRITLATARTTSRSRRSATVAASGELMFYGRGAGGAPTASAVLGDVVAVARNLLSGARGAGESAHADLRVRPMGETVTRYHVSLDVADKAGVLANVASVFAAHDVSIRVVRQEGHADGDVVGGEN